MVRILQIDGEDRIVGHSVDQTCESRGFSADMRELPQAVAISRRRLLIILLYILEFLDRANIAFAKQAF